MSCGGTLVYRLRLLIRISPTSEISFRRAIAFRVYLAHLVSTRSSLPAYGGWGPPRRAWT